MIRPRGAPIPLSGDERLPVVPPRFACSSRSTPRPVRSHRDSLSEVTRRSLLRIISGSAPRLGGHLPRAPVRRLPPSRLAVAVATQVLASSSPYSPALAEGMKKPSRIGGGVVMNLAHLADIHPPELAPCSERCRLPGFLGPSPSTTRDERRRYSLVVPHDNGQSATCQVRS